MIKSYNKRTQNVQVLEIIQLLQQILILVFVPVVVVFILTGKVVVVDASSSSLSSSSSNKSNHRSSLYDYTWTATVDKITGVASSMEVSSLNGLERSSINRNDQYGRIHNNNNKPQHTKISRLLSTFEQYPIWLCTGRVSFGLLTAIPVTSNNSISKVKDKIHNKDLSTLSSTASTALCSYEVRTRFGNINLLTFDRSSCNHRKVIKSNTCCDYYDTIILPMIDGGMMYKSNTSSSKRKRAHLYFTVKTLVKKNKTYECSIITGIHNYLPTLLHFGTLPQSSALRKNEKYHRSSSFRTGLYLSTQSIIHAYVMWRFHNYCISNINKIS